MAPPTPPIPPFPSFSGKGDGASPSDPPAALLPSHVAPDSSGVHPPPCKRVKVEEVPQHSPASAEPSPALCEWEDVPPLNLKLSVTPSFLELVELSRASTQNTVAGSPAMAAATHGAVVDRNKEKQKATNFSASLLKIGSWEIRSVNEGDLVAKCYFAKRKLIWEVLEGGLKNKMEMAWDDITAIRAISYKEKSILELELGRPPKFFRESEPEPGKHTQWKETVDFTRGQARICRRHYVEFPAGSLEKHYGKLLESDSRLWDLSRAPFPRSNSPYFSPNREEIPGILKLDVQRAAVTPKVAQALPSQHCSSVQPCQDPVCSPSQQLPRLPSMNPTGNQFLPIDGAHETCTPTLARRTPVAHGTQNSHQQAGNNPAGVCSQQEHLHPTNEAACHGQQLLDTVRHHLMDDQELNSLVDEQKFLARVRSMDSLIQPDYI